ncbi:hypothetical protein C8R43DRAFT_1117832 [Mycena crocata]|nr:hypothetical protein C8R43DRAFT_1117832 [Mycena crocata]
MDVESTDDEQQHAPWNPNEWISCGKEYHNVPAEVETARRELLKIPPSFAQNLPPKTISIFRLLSLDLPPVSESLLDPMDDDFEQFSEAVASRDIEEILPLLVVPSRSEVQRLIQGLGQAWFDGRKSLCSWLNPDVAFPFWVLTYWGEILDASEAKDLWIQAESWLENSGKTAEESAMKLTIRGLWKTMEWYGNIRGFSSVSTSDLASFFSQKYLGGNLVDAMLQLLSFRLRATAGSVSDSTIIVNTTFAQFVQLLLPGDGGTPTISAHPGAQRYLTKYGSWFLSPDHTHLYLILYRPPEHWTACCINFAEKHIRYGDSLKWSRPKEFFLALNSWTEQHFPDAEFRITDDLPCAIQTDGYNCPIISVNTLAHNIFGDALWTAGKAKAMRMKAFCDIVKHALSAKRTQTLKIHDATDLAENLLAVNPDVNDAFMLKPSNDNARGSPFSGSHPVTATPMPPVAADLLVVDPDVNDTFMPNGIDNGAGVVPRSDSHPVTADGPPEAPVAVILPTPRGTKRAAEALDDCGREKKVAKMSASSSRSSATHSFFDPRGREALAKAAAEVSKPKKKAAPKKPKKPAASKPNANRNVGISKSATAARHQRQDIRDGKFEATATKTQNFQAECISANENCCFEPTASQVQCSTCKKWVKQKEAYSTVRFVAHREAKNCQPPPRVKIEPPPQTLDTFELVAKRPEPKKSATALPVTRPCPGLTRAFSELVGNYLDRTASSGGGGHAVNYYSQKIFKKEFQKLTDTQKDAVYTARLHDHAWRNDTSPGIMACFSSGSHPCLKTVQIHSGSLETPPCAPCKLLMTMKAFKNALNKKAADPVNLKYVPHINQNSHAGMLYAKFKGLEKLVSEDNDFSLERRFFQHVVNGDFKDDSVFTGLIQAKVLAKDREIRGVGNQNFKYDTDLDALFGLIHTISPRAYRELQKHFPMRTERSIKHIASKTPRFPIGIKDETFIYAKQYCENYKYPCGAPLSLSVDDTKLFPALRPLYDGVSQKWFIVGTTGEHIEVPNADGLHETLDELKSSAELASKLRLWVLQIPLPGVPPLVLAIMPLASKVKGPQLAESQIKLMEGLVGHGFRITSSGGDGASVERDCQRRTASASKLMEVRIKHPDPDYPDIIVQLWDIDGNIWVVIQDAKHGRKTFKNNVFSGAHSMTLGNFVVFFRLIHTLGMKPKTPLYRRDFIKSDKMDDPAAARFFSADFLEQASEDPSENLGLVVYLLVFGDFIDAWQSRNLTHHERAKIVIRTHLFLNTWRSFLAKAGYSEARHFISKEAFDIAQILINGLLGLIIIHRDHLGEHPCPLLPWFNASEPNEHCFSGMRDITSDFTLQQAILIVPKLRAKMQASVRIPKNQTDFKKQASGYCHTYYSSENIDYEMLSKFPTDVEFSAAYEMAGQENECLWSMLGVHPDRIKNAPTPGLAPPPPPDPAFEHLYLQEDADLIPDPTEKTAAEELQGLIDSLKSTTNLSRAADQELDACVMASVALSMDELAKIEDLLESNPERFAEIQNEIANALATRPAAFLALLQGMADSALKDTPENAAAISGENPLSFLDISSDDLSPLVALRRRNQTEESRTGVRTYKSSGTYTNHKTGEVKPLSDKQILAQWMQAIIGQDQERGSSTGLNRAVRWKGDSGNTLATAKPKTGNAANAELAAGGRAKEAINRRRTIFAKCKSVSIVAESGIGASDTTTMEDNCYGFAMIGSKLVLVRVISMYSKNGGKAGTHSWVPTCETIGGLSFILVQVYEHEYRKRFKIIHDRHSALGTVHFSHLPSGSFLALLPKEEGVKTTHNHVEMGPRGQAIFEELKNESAALAKAVASLNTVRRKGQSNIHITELSEEDCGED